jgi:hypothetical protein
MNPVRLWAVFELRSYGVNVPDSLQGQRPKATGVNPWYGVYILRFAMESGLISQILEIASMPFPILILFIAHCFFFSSGATSITHWFHKKISPLFWSAILSLPIIY